MYDAVIIPGGARGADTLAGHPSVQELIRRYVERNKLVGMIFAGASEAYLPKLVLSDLSFFGGVVYWYARKQRFLGSLAAQTAKLEKQPLTSHPSVKAQLQDGASPLPSAHLLL